MIVKGLVVVIVMCCQGILCEGNVLLDVESKTEHNQHIVDAVVHIVLNNFPERLIHRKTVLIYGALPDSLYSSLSLANITVLVTTKFIPNHSDIDETLYVREPDQVHNVGICIFLVHSYEEITLALLDVILHRSLVLKDVRMIVIADGVEEFQLIFYLFYWYNYINCIIIDSEQDNQVYYTDFTPYVTYSPEKDDQQFSCWSEKNRDELFIGKVSEFMFCNSTCLYWDDEYWNEGFYFPKCLELTRRKLTKDVTLFSDKTKNLQGYPLYLLAMHTPPSLSVNESKEGLEMIEGKDANFIKVLADRMNFTVKYRKSLSMINNNPIFDNIVMGFMELSLSLHDISANVLYLTYYSYPPISFIYPLEGGGLCFITHRAGEFNMMIQAYKIFQVEVFVLLFVSVTLLTYSIQLSLKRHTKLSLWDRWGMAFTYIFRLFLSYPIPYMGHTGFVKLMLFGLIWCTFVIDFMLQNQLVYLLYTRPLKNQINTLQELYESGLYIEGLPSADALLPVTELNKKINDRFVGIDTMYQCVEYVRTHADKACWLECNLASDISRTFRDNSGKLSIHVGKENSHDFYLTYPIAKNSPLMKRITHYTKTIIEAGLVKIWRESMLNAKPEDVTEVKPLNMEDFDGVFLFVLVCSSFSFVVFIIELVCGRMRKKKLLKVS